MSLGTDQLHGTSCSSPVQLQGVEQLPGGPMAGRTSRSRKLETLYEEPATGGLGISWEFPLTASETRARLFDVIEFENGTYREELQMNEDVIKSLFEENKRLQEDSKGLEEEAMFQLEQTQAKQIEDGELLRAKTRELEDSLREERSKYKQRTEHVSELEKEIKQYKYRLNAQEKMIQQTKEKVDQKSLKADQEAHKRAEIEKKVARDKKSDQLKNNNLRILEQQSAEHKRTCKNLRAINSDLEKTNAELQKKTTNLEKELVRCQQQIHTLQQQIKSAQLVSGNSVSSSSVPDHMNGALNGTSNKSAEVPGALPQNSLLSDTNLSSLQMELGEEAGGGGGILAAKKKKKRNRHSITGGELSLNLDKIITPSTSKCSSKQVTPSSGQNTNNTVGSTATNATKKLGFGNIPSPSRKRKKAKADGSLTERADRDKKTKTASMIAPPMSARAPRKNELIAGVPMQQADDQSIVNAMAFIDGKVAAAPIDGPSLCWNGEKVKLERENYWLRTIMGACGIAILAYVLVQSSS